MQVGIGRLVPLTLLAAVALGTAPRAAGHAAEAGNTSREYRYMMGTSIEVEAYGGDAATRRAATDEAFAAFAEIDRLMSNYRGDSELSRINGEAADRPVSVTDAMMGVLEAAARISRASNGAFDVTIAPAVRAWGFHDKQAHVPSAAELAAIRPLVDYRNLLLDPTHHTVTFARRGVEIDLGGIAKGFAVEIAAGVLRRHGLAGFIDAGGNQYLLGLPPGKRTWTVGVKNPDAPDRVLGAIETGETSVSTSADNANFLVAGTRRYGHLLDPHTLAPSEAALSATIVSRDGTLADAMSKAAFVLGPDAGIALVDAMPDMGGVVAFRRHDGTVGTVVSRRLSRAWHPVVPAATEARSLHR